MDKMMLDRAFAAFDRNDKKTNKIIIFLVKK